MHPYYISLVIFITARICEGYVFIGVCLSTFGACVAGRCVWQGVCMGGRGLHGRGACMVVVGACVSHMPPANTMGHGQ